ncbi:MAG: translocation/assembly module TamB domain-containing protein, partial [Geminicoccaceae bacterium]
LVLLIVGAAIFVQTGPGKRFLASQLSSRLSTPNAGIEITGIQGRVPIDMQVARLQLSDPEGVWLDATELALDWSPIALLSGRMRIDTVLAKRIHVGRLPDNSEEDEEEEPNNEPFRLPPLPTSLPQVTVTKLLVEEIDLDAPVLGEAASFKLNGSLTAADDGRHADLTLDLERMDQGTAFLTMISTISLDPTMLAIDIDASETGGLLAQLTGRAEAGDLDIVLTGQGPIDNWSGRLEARADGLGTANADLFLALVEQPQLRMEAVLRPVIEALPAEIDEIIGESLGLNLAITQTEAQAIDVGRLDIEADKLGVKANGKVDFDRGDLILNAALDAPALQAFSDMTGVALTGKAGATLKIDGTIEEPRGVVDLRGHGLGADGIEIADFETSINLTTTIPLSAEHAAFDVRSSGSAKGFAIPDTPLPDDRVAWTADLVVPSEGVITLRHSTIETADAVLETQGTIDPNSLISDLDLKLNAKTLGRLTAPYGQNIDGQASINAALKTTDSAKTINIDLRAALTQLAGLPEGATELVGDKLDVDAVVKLDEFRRLKLSDVLLNGSNATAKGGFDLDLESREMAGDVAASLPHLAELASLIEQPIEGALDLDATIGGDLDAPQVDLTLRSQDLIVTEEPIEALSLAVNGQDLLTSPEGALQLDVTARDTPLTLALNYRLDEADLALQNVDLKGPETDLGGEFAIDLDALLISGALTGKSNDLSALETLIQQPLEGSIDLEVRLSPDQSRQNADLSLRGQAVGGDFGKIEEIDLTAALQDLLGKPEIVAKANLKGFKQDEVDLETISLQTEGDLEGLTIDLDLDGEVIEPLSLKSISTLSLSTPITLDINRLDGQYADEQFSLNGPMQVEQDHASLKLANLDFRFAGASLKGEIDIGERDVVGQIDLRALPLGWFQRFDGPALDGTASADIDLGGTVDRPRIEAVVNLKDVQTHQITDADLPPADIEFRADLKEGRLDTSLSATGLTEREITASAALPMTLSLRPFDLDLPEDGRIEGAAKATISLTRLGDLLALDGQILRGDVSADLTLAGTIETPLVEGSIGLENGAYENIFSGTELRDIQLEAIASSTRIAVDRLTAKTNDAGTIEGSGWIDLDPAADFPLSLSLSMDQAELLSRDDIEGTISGDIAMLGDLSTPKIEGQLLVNHAEASIPEGSGPDLPVIEVEEVGGTFINFEKPEGKETETAPPFDPELDVTIDLPNKVYARGRGLESEWEGNLAITGPTSAPLITGRLEIKKGYFDFVEKRFVFEKGIIDFNGVSPPNPIITIEATATESDFKAIVKVDGPADQFKLRLESEPALPEDEVLAKLLFDRELSEIGAVEATKLALALNKLRGGGGFDAFGEIRNALRIDTLDIVSGEETEDSRVKAGKYLNDDVYLEVEQGAAEDSSRARVEVEILPNFSLEADTGSDSTGGVGVKWRFDY